MTENENAVIGSCLSIDAHMKQLHAELSEIKKLLIGASATCRSSADSEMPGIMHEALQDVSAKFNRVIDCFRPLVDIKSRIDKIGGGQLPTLRLRHDVECGMINVASTDEGFAETLASISALKTPVDRMDALCLCMAELDKSITHCSEAADALQRRIRGGTFDNSPENATETKSAKALRQAQKERITVLEKRLATTASAFFKERKAVIETTEAPTRRLASLFPYGNDATRVGARIHDACGTLHLLTGLDSTFKNPTKPPYTRRKRRLCA